MLTELHITNLAVIEDATIELTEGLNCFTGETGAGKSLVLGAFGVLLGLRSAGDLLRAGADEGRVSGVFELSDNQIIHQLNELADLDLNTDLPGEQLLITRKLFSSGRTSVTINGQPATAGMLKNIGELLVDVHGQHDHQYLLKPANQLIMLDRFGQCENLREQFTAIHRQLHEFYQRKDELQTSQTLRKQQLELYEFQAQEIDDVEPTEGEFEELASRFRLLSNMKKVRQETAAAYSALYDNEGAIIERLQTVGAIISELAELDEQLKPIGDDINGAMAQLQDTSFSLSRYMNRIELDSEELAEVEQRLNELNRLISKYAGQTGQAGGLDEVIAYRKQLEEQVKLLRSESEDLGDIEQQIQPLVTKLETVGKKLTQKRTKAAKKLTPLIEEQLCQLGMAEAKFDVTFQQNDATGHKPTGFDQIEMQVQANPGQPAKPLRKVASGGELSRIMLAIKSILAQADRISVLVFDEIDANIGGRLGTVIGQKLRGLAASHQVLCITHLPQIAAFADCHLKIKKQIEKGQTKTTINAIAGNERIDEIAAMLTGKHATKTTRQQAKEMLALAK